MGLSDSVGFGAGMVVAALGVTSLGVLLLDLEVSGWGSGSRGAPLAVRLLSRILRPSSDSGFSDAPVAFVSRQPSRKLPGGALSSLACGLPAPLPALSVQKARVTHKVLWPGGVARLEPPHLGGGRPGWD